MENELQIEGNLPSSSKTMPMLLPNLELVSACPPKLMEPKFEPLLWIIQSDIWLPKSNENDVGAKKAELSIHW